MESPLSSLQISDTPRTRLGFSPKAKQSGTFACGRENPEYEPLLVHRLEEHTLGRTLMTKAHPTGCPGTQTNNNSDPSSNAVIYLECPDCLSPEESAFLLHINPQQHCGGPKGIGPPLKTFWN